MSDNLKIVEQNIDTAINPNAGVGQILAANHNQVLKEVVRKAGKYTGFPFVSRGQSNAGVITSGFLIWNNNPMNNTSNFVITTAKLTADLNDVGVVLNQLSLADIIKFKDFEGRSVFLEYVSHSSSDDGNGNDTYDIVVKGFADNLNYTYQSAEEQVSVIDVITKGSIPVTSESITIDGVVYEFKKKGTNGTPAAPEKYDIAEGGVRTITDSNGTYEVWTILIYNTGAPTDINSWQVVYEKELLF